MSGKTILITGASGHVGYAVLLEALRQGHIVKAAVRSKSSSDLIKHNQWTQPFQSQLSFVTVPDITVDGAFDEAVQDVDAVIHVASPIPRPDFSNFEEELIKPAVRGTKTILYSALKQRQIKKVVITSSSGALIDPDNLEKAVNANTVVPDKTGPYPDVFSAYLSSKAKALATVKKFIEDEKPHFGVANILPSYIVGRNLLVTTPEGVLGGSNGIAMAPVVGQRNEDGTLFNVAHLDDVAKVHIGALDPKHEGNFGVNYQWDAGAVWDDANEVAKKYFPEAVKSGVLPANGSTKTISFRFDASETERQFGIKFKDFDEMMKDIIGFYVELSQN